MAFNLHGRSFLMELDFSPDELRFLLKLSADLKGINSLSLNLTRPRSRHRRQPPRRQ